MVRNFPKSIEFFAKKLLFVLKSVKSSGSKLDNKITYFESPNSQFIFDLVNQSFK